jgi:hypothetical protein
MFPNTLPGGRAKMTEPITFYKYITTYSTVIPIIQRDYAQGRKGPKERQVLQKFLLDLRNSVKNKKRLSLNFIYGMEKIDNEFMPIDGQQRLTTLFLFYWFTALRCHKLDEFIDSAKKFTYQTRSSAIDFFDAIQSKDKTPDFYNLNSGDELCNFNWYSLDWNNDPTVNSVIGALNQMFDLFKDEDFCGWWQTITASDCPITFRYIPINKPEGKRNEDNFDCESRAASTYIKMNARGKHLSEFENTKALLHRIRKEGEKDGDFFSKQYESCYIRVLEKCASLETGVKGNIGKLSGFIDDYMMQFLINLYNDLYCLNDDKAASDDGKIMCADYYEYSNAVKKYTENESVPYKGFPYEYFSLIDMVFTDGITQLKEEQFIGYCKNGQRLRPVSLRFIASVVYAEECKYDEEGIAEWEYFLNNFHFFDRDENTEKHEYFARAMFEMRVLAQKIHAESSDSFLIFLDTNKNYPPSEKIRSIESLDWKEEHLIAHIIRENNLKYYYFDGIQKRFNNRIRAFLQMAGYWNGVGNRVKLDAYITLAGKFDLKSEEDPPWEIRRLTYLFATGFMGSKKIGSHPYLQKEIYCWSIESDMNEELLAAFANALDYMHEQNITDIEVLDKHLMEIARELYDNRDWRAFVIRRKEAELFYHVSGDRLENSLYGQLIFPLVKKLDINGKDINGPIPYHHYKTVSHLVGNNNWSNRRISFARDVKIISDIMGDNIVDYTFYTAHGTEFTIYKYIDFDGGNHRFEKRKFNVQKLVDEYDDYAQKIVTEVISTMPEQERNECLTKVIYNDTEALQKECDAQIGVQACTIGHYYNEVITFFNKKNTIKIVDDTILEKDSMLLGLDPNGDLLGII